MKRIQGVGEMNTFGKFWRHLIHWRSLIISIACSHLASELGEEFLVRQETSDSTDDLLTLGLRLVPFLLSHNGEADAVDLLLELESISSIIPHVDANTYARVCLYMVSCVNLLVPPDDKEFLKTARQIYRKHGKFTESITLALRLQDMEMVKEDFEAPSNP